MNPAIKEVAGGYLAPKVLKAFRFRYLVFGAVAYYGLRLMRQRGIFPDQAGAALDVIDNGIAGLKNQFGLGESSSSISQTVH